MLARKKSEFSKYTQGLYRTRDSLSKLWDHQLSASLAAKEVVRIPDIDLTQVDGIFDTVCCQRNGSGRAITELSELYWNAALVKTTFEEFLRQSIKKCRLTTTALELVPLKNKLAAQDKANFNYSARPGPGVSWVFDVIRASVNCTTLDEISRFVSCILQAGMKFQVLRLKNRFRTPLPSEYRDILMNIKVDLGDGVSHVCELQLHLTIIKDMSTTVCSSQASFEYFHTYFHGQVLSKEDIEKKVALLHEVQTFNGREELHPYILSSIENENKLRLHSLQWILRFMGEYFLAEAVLRRLLSYKLTVERMVETDLEVMSTMDALATVLQSQNVTDEAEIVIQQLYTSREAVWGQADYRTLKSVDDYASILQAQKKYAEASKILQRAYATKKSIFGIDNESTLRTMDNLCEALISIKYYKDAEDMCRKILKAREKVLGSKSSITLRAMQNLAMILRRRGCLKESEKLYRDIREARAAEMSASHPIALKATENLAAVLQDMRRYKEAFILHSAVFSTREHELGPDHVDTISSMVNIAYIYFLQDRFLLAAKMFERAHQLFEGALGPDHRRTQLAKEKGKACLRLANVTATKFADSEQASLFLWLNTQSAVGVGRAFRHTDRCEHCNAAITLFRREHHCRVCVRALCNDCSALRKVVVEVDPCRPVRVCDCCSEALDLCSSSQDDAASSIAATPQPQQTKAIKAPSLTSSSSSSSVSNFSGSSSGSSHTQKKAQKDNPSPTSVRFVDYEEAPRVTCSPLWISSIRR